MLGGGPRRCRRPRIFRSFLFLYLIVSSLEIRSSPSTPSDKSISPSFSVRVRHIASINDSTLCFSPICFDVESIPAQFSPSLSPLLLYWKRLSLSPASVRVSLNLRSVLSPSLMGMRVSLTLIDPVLFSSWLFSSGLYRRSIALSYLELVPRKVLCSGSLVVLSCVPIEHLNSSSILLDVIPSQTTHFLSFLLDEAQVSAEVIKRLIFVSNASSEPSVSLRVRLDLVYVRHCSSHDKSVKSTNRSIPALSPLMDCSIRSYHSNPIGVCKLNRCSPRYDRYTLTTPIVLNLNSKFIVDFGVLHGLNSVMVNASIYFGICFRRVSLSNDHSYRFCPPRRVIYNLLSPLVLKLVSKLFSGDFGLSLYGVVSRGIVSDSFAIGYSLRDPSSDRCCYRLCTACILGTAANHKHTDFFDAHSESPMSPEVHRRLVVRYAATAEKEELGRTSSHLLGLLCASSHISARDPSSFIFESKFKIKRSHWAIRFNNGLLKDNSIYLGLYLPFRHSELIGLVVFISACSMFVVVSSDRLKTRFSEHLFVTVV